MAILVICFIAALMIAIATASWCATALWDEKHGLLDVLAAFLLGSLSGAVILIFGVAYATRDL